MSRDRTTEEVVEDILYKPRRDLENLELQLKILVETAKVEGRKEVERPTAETVEYQRGMDLIHGRLRICECGILTAKLEKGCDHIHDR